MKSVHFVCLFAILISMLVLAQSSRAPLGTQPSSRLVGQDSKRKSASTPQVAGLTERGNRGFRATRQESSSSGLNFAPAVTYDSGGLETVSVAVADVNGDGKPDLLVANYCASGNSCTNTNFAGVVGVLLGNGDGTFQTAVLYGSGGYYGESVAVADVNGDGKPDLVVANRCASAGGGGCTNSAGVVGVLLGNGDGTFQTAVTYGSGGHFGFGG